MKKYDCQFSEDFQIAKHPDYCHKGNFQLQFNPELSWEDRLKKTGWYNHLKEMGHRSLEEFLGFISQEIENAKKEERENFRGLINDEILIAHKEGTATSRLTSLWMRLDK